jgi:hypothetical protein
MHGGLRLFHTCSLTAGLSRSSTWPKRISPRRRWGLGGAGMGRGRGIAAPFLLYIIHRPAGTHEAKLPLWRMNLLQE